MTEPDMVKDERDRCLQIVRDVCVLGSPAAADSEYERAMDDVGNEICRRITDLVGKPREQT
jgi:hypothetical protein